MGVVIAFDVTEEQSFLNVKSWLQQVRDNASPHAICVLVATKCDRPDRKVSVTQGEQLAEELRMKMFETSAKSNINIAETFAYLSREIRAKFPDMLETGVNLRKSNKSLGCC